jgi:hypothetical protein
MAVVPGEVPKAIPGSNQLGRQSQNAAIVPVRLHPVAQSRNCMATPRQRCRKGVLSCDVPAGGGLCDSWCVSRKVDLFMIGTISPQQYK